MLKKRILAYIIDFCIVLVIIVLISVVLGDKQLSGGYKVKYPLSLIPTSVIFLYFLLLEHFFSRTIGKMILKLKIVKVKDGKDINIFNSLGRHLFDFIDIYLFIGVIMIFINKEKRLGDFIGKTKVVSVDNTL
jgi:uncharacterized RDD family membrane protein YckC